MEVHFSILGIRRGVSEADMRKAYKAKALSYHPDRNPNGAEQFKRITAAYEEVCKHYKKHGGVDHVEVEISSSTSFGFGSGMTNRNGHAAAPSKPLFTEEELFGRAPTSDFGIFGAARTGSGSFTSGRRGFRQSNQQRATPPTTDPAHTAAEEHRRQAHGSRAPESGYTAFSPAELGAFRSQMSHFAEMEKKKEAMQAGKDGSGAGDAHPTTSSPSKGRHPQYGRRAGSASPNDEALPNNTSVEDEILGEGPLPPRRPSMYRQSSVPSTTSASETRHANPTPSMSSSTTSRGAGAGGLPDNNPSMVNIAMQKELEERWLREREAQAAMTRAEEAMRETERRLRREQREAEVREEWERTQSEMDMERTTRAAEERTEELRQQAANPADMNIDRELRQCALDRHSEREAAVRRLLPAEEHVARMSVAELFMLREAANAFSASVCSRLESRMRAQTTCLVCQIERRDPKSAALFACGHPYLCAKCALTTPVCRLCGADRVNQ